MEFSQIQSAYIAPINFSHELINELCTDFIQHGQLILSNEHEKKPIWAQDIWHNPKVIEFSSINEAAQILKKEHPFWYFYSNGFHRRGSLIQNKLRKIKIPEIDFPILPDIKNIGCWTLLDKNTLLYSINRWKKFPLGHYPFIEDKTTPPNRAYLKLWEAFTYLEQLPKPTDICLDLGSSPGGWTLVLSQFANKVYSLDKAPLDPKISSLKNVVFQKESAFAVDPQSFGEIDWLCCDVICYPDRLLKMINSWLEAETCKNFICTIKLQGETDFNIIKEFQKIEGSEILHLEQNKHELTFIKLSQEL